VGLLRRGGTSVRFGGIRGWELSCDWGYLRTTLRGGGLVPVQGLGEGPKRCSRGGRGVSPIQR
jgi:hypothetical protein